MKTIDTHQTKSEKLKFLCNRVPVQTIISQHRYLFVHSVLSKHNLSVTQENMTGNFYLSEIKDKGWACIGFTYLTTTTIDKRIPFLDVLNINK